MMNIPNRKLIISIIAAIIVGIAVLPVGPQAAGESLWDKLRGSRSRETKIKRELREIKERQREAYTELVTAQQELERSEVRLRTARNKLAATREELDETRKQLSETKAELDQHQTAMQQRILAIYKAGQPTYVEVVLQATSFEDFSNRAAITRRMATADQDLLMHLVAEKQTYERQKAQLEEKEREEKALEAKIEQHRDEVAARKAKAQRLAHKANTDRAEAERQLAAMEAASRQIEYMLAQRQRGSSGRRYAGKWSGRLRRPVSGGYISSPFGWRIHPITHTRRFHDGVDIAVPTGTAIRAADKGLVVYAGWYGVYGKTVLIDHGSGLSTMYAHCSRTAVSPDDVVSRGQVIGYVGSTGWSTGPHLHFGVRKYGKPIHPPQF